MPATPLQLLAPGGAVAQVPSDAPGSFSQTPVQHCSSAPQTSPGCVQKEEARAQVPASHHPEQQSSLAPQELPAVAHWSFKAEHRPASQLPPQQSSPLLQVCPSEMQRSPQVPPTQLRPQHSMAEAQEAPAVAHSESTETHCPSAASQSPEQQSVPREQAPLSGAQEFAPPLPPELICPLSGARRARSTSEPSVPHATNAASTQAANKAKLR